MKVVARGAGTSLSGGALPSADCVVVGLARMNRILDIDYENRVATVEAGVTNINITNAVSRRGFFYAPDPSSQLACTIAGNVAMNSGGAHCLKYGVTTNNVLGVKMVLIDGTVVDIGGGHLDAAGYDLLGLVIGSEGQLGVVTEVDRAHPARRRRRAADADGLRLAPKRPAPASPRSSPRASSRWRSNTWTARRSRPARPSPMPAIRSTSRRC